MSGIDFKENQNEPDFEWFHHACEISQAMHLNHRKPLLGSSLGKDEDINTFGQLGALADALERVAALRLPEVFEGMPSDKAILEQLDKLTTIFVAMEKFYNPRTINRTKGQSDAAFGKRIEKIKTEDKSKKYAWNILTDATFEDGYGNKVGIQRWASDVPKVKAALELLKREIKNRGYVEQFGGFYSSNPPAHSLRVDLMGIYLPDLFYQTYPDESDFTFNETIGQTGERQPSGAGFTFVWQAMIALGYEGITFEAIRRNFHRVGETRS